MYVKVFLNEGPDNFFGFHNTFANDPQLRLAAEFDIDAPVGEGVPYNWLEEIFEQLNVGGEPGYPAYDYTEAYRAAGNRSLSVGDVVVIGEVAYAVASAGWEKVSADEIDKALRAGAICREAELVEEL